MQEKISLKQPIPEIIHFIWVGGPIPDQYLHRILSLAEVAYDHNGKYFDINLWIDNEHNYRKAFDRLRASFANLCLSISNEQLDNN